MAKARLEDHIGRRFKLRELYILSTVVQWGSMAKAAARLAMSQPAVSEAIASLEATLQVRLLDRGPRGIEPTIYAQALLKRGTIVFDELRQGIRDIEYLADPATGEVRIGCPESLAAGFVPAMIDGFSRRHPQVTFQVSMPAQTPWSSANCASAGSTSYSGGYRRPLPTMRSI
jgi:DNA-binding transcriptional LysR family regulator